MVLTAAADSRKVAGAPAAAMRNPAIEGAITRLLPKAMEISGTAERNSGRGSRRGKNDARAGSSMAADSPNRNAPSARCHSCATPSIVATPTMIIAIAALICATPISLRASMRSASTPPSSVRANWGTKPQRWMKPSCACDPVISKASHPSVNANMCWPMTCVTRASQ